MRWSTRGGPASNRLLVQVAGGTCDISVEQQTKELGPGPQRGGRWRPPSLSATCDICADNHTKETVAPSTCACHTGAQHYRCSCAWYCANTRASIYSLSNTVVITNRPPARRMRRNTCCTTDCSITAHAHCRTCSRVSQENNMALGRQ